MTSKVSFHSVRSYLGHKQLNLDLGCCVRCLKLSFGKMGWEREGAS